MAWVRTVCGRFLSFGFVLKHVDYFLNSRAELRLNCERGHHSFLSRTWPCLGDRAGLGPLGQGHCGPSVLLCQVQQDPGATCLTPALMEEWPRLRLSSFLLRKKLIKGAGLAWLVQRQRLCWVWPWQGPGALSSSHLSSFTVLLLK